MITENQEGKWAHLINQVKDEFLPSLPKLEDVKKFEDAFLKDSNFEAYQNYSIVFHKENGNVIAFTGSTGCATCDEGGYRATDLRIFNSSTDFNEFIKNSYLGEIKIIEKYESCEDVEIIDIDVNFFDIIIFCYGEKIPVEISHSWVWENEKDMWDTSDKFLVINNYKIELFKDFNN